MSVVVASPSQGLGARRREGGLLEPLIPWRRPRVGEINEDQVDRVTASTADRDAVMDAGKPIISLK